MSRIELCNLSHILKKNPLAHISYSSFPRTLKTVREVLNSAIRRAATDDGGEQYGRSWAPRDTWRHLFLAKFISRMSDRDGLGVVVERQSFYLV